MPGAARPPSRTSGVAIRWTRSTTPASANAACRLGPPSVKSLIAYAKVNGDKVMAGTGGPGTPSHVSVVYFANTIDAATQPIHYKGSGPAMQDVIAGHIQLALLVLRNAGETCIGIEVERLA